MSYYSSLHPSCSHKSLLLCLGPSQFFSILRQYWIHLSLFTKTYYRLLLQESSSSCPCFCLITWYLFYTTFEWSKCFHLHLLVNSPRSEIISNFYIVYFHLFLYFICFKNFIQVCITCWTYPTIPLYLPFLLYLLLVSFVLLDILLLL